MTHNINRTTGWQWLFVLALLCLFTLPVRAVIPDNIDYQGYLTDDAGSPINGTVSVTFSLYNVDTGGIALWSDTHTIDTNDGLFTVKLGGTGAPFPVDLFDNPLWLGINVESDGEMSPRIAMSSAGFAHKADDALTLEGQTAASLDQSAHISDTGNPHSVTAAQTGAVTSASFTLHTSDSSAHHSKTTSFTELSDSASDAQIPDTITVNQAANADTLDGLDSTYFMTSSTDNWVNITGDTMTGNLNVMARIGIGTATPAYVLEIEGGNDNHLAYFNSDNNTSGSASASAIFAIGDARDTDTGYGRGASFAAYGGNTSGIAWGSQHFAIANGTSNAFGVYSDVTGGTTTGRRYAFYGLGDGYFSGNVSIGTPFPNYPLEVRNNADDFAAGFLNYNSTSGSAYAEGIFVVGNASGTDTGWGRGGEFWGIGGDTSGEAHGILSIASASGSSIAYGIFSNAEFGSTTGSTYSFYGIGDARVVGTLTKTSGAFKIDHPLDPENKYLYHSFVESPDMKNVYDGVVTLDEKGQARVTLPDWFNALNKDFRYQLTPIGAPGPNLYIAQKITNNTFAIAGGQPGMEVSWQVTGIRQDAYANTNRIPVEEDKPANETGTYLHPEAFGLARERSLATAQAQEMGLKISEPR